MPGVDPSYAHQPFYARTLDEDAQRVNALFAAQQSIGFSVQERWVWPAAPSMSPNMWRDFLNALLPCG